VLALPTCGAGSTGVVISCETAVTATVPSRPSAATAAQSSAQRRVVLPGPDLDFAFGRLALTFGVALA
jgi:hypothetical protein